jgi:glutamate formiminotransferase/formiminotetrahydrofolate cyclodeaminase
VITFVGPPSEVCEAAFRLVKKAASLFDMNRHKGEHPRFGSTDVCPLVPVSGISMDETVEYARKLAFRIGTELGIPVYCYEFAAFEEKRKNLANCRAGEYEGLQKKLIDREWKPDFGPDRFDEHVAKTGAIAVGARNFLVAYNVNLNTTSARRANAIAFDIREKGRVRREGNPLTGKIVTDEKGNPVYDPGLLKCVKGIGWYLEEFGIAQLSFNLTVITVTSVHHVFEASCERAAARGIRVTGSELVGMIPLNAMLDAGKYFLKKQQRSVGIPDEEIIKIAIKSLGLNELKPFDPKKKIIEYILEEGCQSLVDLSLKEYSERTASETVAPGGGSASAYIGALGVALGTMVANLSAHKRGWDDRWEFFSAWAEKGKFYHDQLLKLVDEDTRAYNGLMAAYQLPKTTEEEKLVRKKAVDEATKHAIEVPFRVMEVSCQSMEVIQSMVDHGNPNSISDAGVGALAARAAVQGAFLNVKINIKNFPDRAYAEMILKRADSIFQETIVLEKRILEIVEYKLL